MTEEDLLDIQKIIGYKFKNICLLQQAFVRDSYVHETLDRTSNQPLYWIGQKVLANFIDQKLISYFTKVNDLREIQLNKITYEQLIDKEDYFLSDTFIAKQVETYNLSKYMVMGENDIKRKANKKYSVKKELFCSIVGAVNIDSNSSFSISAVIDNILDIDYYLTRGIDAVNYVEKLKNWSDIGSLSPVRYMVNTSSFGYGQTTHQCTCFLDNLDRLFTGNGSSSSEARNEAARKAYKFLEENNYLYSLKDIIKDCTLANAVTTLQELANKKLIPEPEYTYKEIKDPVHDQIWEVSITIDGLVDKIIARDLLKRNAKKQVAYQALQLLIK